MDILVLPSVCGDSELWRNRSNHLEKSDFLKVFPEKLRLRKNSLSQSWRPAWGCQRRGSWQRSWSKWTCQHLCLRRCQMVLVHLLIGHLLITILWHLLINIVTSAHQNPDISSSKFGHLLITFWKSSHGWWSSRREGWWLSRLDCWRSWKEWTQTYLKPRLDKPITYFL